MHGGSRFSCFGAFLLALTMRGSGRWGAFFIYGWNKTQLCTTYWALPDVQARYGTYSARIRSQFARATFLLARSTVFSVEIDLDGVVHSVHCPRLFGSVLSSDLFGFFQKLELTTSEMGSHSLFPCDFFRIHCWMND